MKHQQADQRLPLPRIELDDHVFLLAMACKPILERCALGGPQRSLSVRTTQAVNSSTGSVGRSAFCRPVAS